MPVPLPSNCRLCPFLDEKELLWLYHFDREWYDRWVQIERVKLERFVHLGDKNLGVWGKKTLPEVLKDAKAKYADMTPEALHEHKMSHGHCVASRY